MAGAVARAEQDLSNLRKEIGDLEERLAAAREKAGKITVFLEMAQIYGANGESASRQPDAAPNAGDAADMQPLRFLDGLAKSAAREVIAVLRERREPVQTKELLSVLRTRGIEIPGQNPVSNLSGYLSRSPDLLADRAVGWSLREWAEPKIDTAGGKSTIMGELSSDAPKSAKGDRRPKGGVSGAAVRETLTILRERRRPMRTRELLDILASRQIVIRGKNPVISLSSHLCRTPELVADRSQGWSLTEWKSDLLTQPTNLDHAAE
jgi:hypothetical protein